MAKEPGAAGERAGELDEARKRLDAVAAKLVMKFGTEAVARLLVDLAGRYKDIFVAEVTRARDDWNMEHPGGQA